MGRRASSAIGELAGTGFEFSVGSVHRVEIPAICSLVGDPSSPAAGGWTTVDGDIQGVLGLVMPWREAQSLWRVLEGFGPAMPEDVLDSENVVFREVMDAVAWSFVQAVAGLTGLTLQSSAAAACSGSLEFVLDSMRLGSEDPASSALAFTIRLAVADSHSDGCLLFAPSVGGLSALLEALGLREAA